MDNIGGSEQIVPAHATVIRLEFPSLSAALTSTAGTGYKRFPGLNCLFPIKSNLPAKISLLLLKSHNDLRRQLLFPGNHSRQENNAVVLLQSALFLVGNMERGSNQLLRPLADAVEVKLHLDLAPGCVVRSTEDDLYQIVFNLVENAIKYNLPGGSVDVTLWSEGEMVYLTVEDTGVGIPEDDLPKIFDRFYRVDKARSRAAGGTGLGLSIVRDTVRQHGGAVSARAREWGEGTCFQVSFLRCREKEGKR